MDGKFTSYTTYEEDDESSIDECCKSSDDEETDRAFRDYLKSETSGQVEKKLSIKEAALEFEKEMSAELDELLETKQKAYMSEGKKSVAVEEEKKTKEKAAAAAAAEEESDTDSEAELATGVRTKKKRAHFTNDELFYDPDMDDEDEKWASEKRKEAVAKKSSLKKPSSMGKTDAVLNCPCCMTMLTMDCQRHEIYQTQYRAMFVFNCKVKQDEQLKLAKNDAPNKKKKDVSNMVEYETYKPVECEICKTEVGVYDDKDEIYYFFNVLASHA